MWNRQTNSLVELGSREVSARKGTKEKYKLGGGSTKGTKRS